MGGGMGSTVGVVGEVAVAACAKGVRMARRMGRFGSGSIAWWWILMSFDSPALCLEGFGA